MNYFDDLCNRLFEFIPRKKGTSYEIIVACILWLLNQDGKVTHNHFEKSSFSEDSFQLDGLLEKEEQSIRSAIEAKNYLDSKDKVDRADIQKLAGALIVTQEVNSAIFASATGFTSDAQQYAKDLKSATGKPIDLYVIRPIEEKDTEGYILGLDMELVGLGKDFARSTFELVFTNRGYNTLHAMGYKKGDSFPYSLEFFYDKHSNIVDSMFSISSRCNGTGSVDFTKQPTFIPINNRLVEIQTLKYDIKPKITRSTFSIKIDPVVYIKSDDPKLDIWMTSDRLKIAFNNLNNIHHWK